MKRKGFTLVELLAVIVILAIISLIATPMILGVIEKARKGAAESSALGYLDAIEKQIMMNQLDSTKPQIKDGIYNLPMNGISIKGEVPEEGWVIIERGTISNYSMKILDYVVTEGKINTNVTEVVSVPVCKRATILHTEECTQTSDYCYAAGYIEGSEKGTTLIYGNLGAMGEDLISGDAFDCDVNGDGVYNSENERFYFVSGLDGSEESDIAVLIYYNNTTLGLPDNTATSKIAYYSVSDENWHGPVTAITNLPTVEQWSNVNLKNTSRIIVNELGTLTTENGINKIENPFNYNFYSARLLTYQEIGVACGGDNNPTSSGELDNCNYLLENTKYSNQDKGTYGYWLETPRAAYAYQTWFVYAKNSLINNDYVSTPGHRGTRPVIEVPKSKILY